MCQGVVKGAGGTNLGINLEQISSLTEAEGIGLPLLWLLPFSSPSLSILNKVSLVFAICQQFGLSPLLGSSIAALLFLAAHMSPAMVWTESFFPLKNPSFRPVSKKTMWCCTGPDNFVSKVTTGCPFRHWWQEKWCFFLTLSVRVRCLLNPKKVTQSFYIFHLLLLKTIQLHGELGGGGRLQSSLCHQGGDVPLKRPYDSILKTMRNSSGPHCLHWRG